jgi:hypothetical protein
MSIASTQYIFPPVEYVMSPPQSPRQRSRISNPVGMARADRWPAFIVSRRLMASLVGVVNGNFNSFR